MTRKLGSRYELTELIGYGGMGAVWKGHDDEGRPRAFKLLRDDLGADATLVQRFLQERTILTSLDHPGLVRVHDLVVEGDTMAIVLDLVQDGDLAQVLASGTLPPSDVAHLGAQVAAALQYLHDRGIVHRDIKPHNILLARAADGHLEPRITDFGIAVLLDSSPRLTSSTSMAGTAQYAAPELIENQEPTSAVDVYGLGVLLYELCCGVTPFAGSSSYATLRLHVEATPGRPDGVPDALWSLLEAMLSKAPSERPAADLVSTRLPAIAVAVEGIPAAPRLTEPPAHTSLREQSDTVVVSRPSPAASEAPPPAGRRGRRPVVIAALAALVLAVVVGTAYAAWPEDPEPEASESAGTTNEASAEAADPAADGYVDETDDPETSEPPTPSPTPTPDPMPDVVGLSPSAAERELPDGTTVTFVDTYESDITRASVTEQEPAAGEEIGDEVVLHVARPLATVYLSSLDTVSDGYWGSQVASLSGASYPHSLVAATSYYDDDGTSSWNLARGYRSLQATVGLDDESSAPAAVVRVEVYLDQVKTWETEVTFGEYVELDLDVTDALRLEIRYIVTYEDDSGGYPYVVLGDARLLGVAEEMPPLEDE